MPPEWQALQFSPPLHKRMVITLQSIKKPPLTASWTRSVHPLNMIWGFINYTPYRHRTSSPCRSLSKASEGSPIISNVFSHTWYEVSMLCASSEGFVGRQSWERKAQTGHSSAFSNSQYSGTWGSVAAKRALLEPAVAVIHDKVSLYLWVLG
jgi:hypothetical protein